MNESKTAKTFITKENIEQLLLLIEKDVNKKCSIVKAKEKFDEYLHYTESLLERYGLPAANKKEIKNRYLKETIGVSFFETYLKSVDYYKNINFNKMYPEKKYYDWYNINSKIQNKISGLIRLETSAIPQFFTNVTQKLLNDAKKSFGEFYTPITIAEYLSTSLGKLEDIFYRKKSIIDPACGIGTLLCVTINNILSSIDRKDMDSKEFLKFIYEDIRGFDIQPYAVILTRFQLSTIILSQFQYNGFTPKNIQKILAFPKIELKDSLITPPDFADKEKVDFAIANPPYRKISAKKIPYFSHYKKILNGHPNLYQLFLWWSTNAVRKNGKIVFLIPQSFTSGLYNQRLRNELESACEVNNIVKFRDKNGIFPDVQQPLMVLSLSKGREDIPNKNRFISISVSSKSQDITKTKRMKIKKNKVIRDLGNGLPWCISDNILDYVILDKVYKKSAPLKDYSNVDIRNGGFVWNQNKLMLRSKRENDNLPLVYASTIKPFEFNFDKKLLGHNGKKSFVLNDEKFQNLHYDKSIILIQRTVPKISGQKIYACTVPQDFIKIYNSYLVENHVNVIKFKDNLSVDDKIFGITAWLNSKLFNFIFNTINGNSHISLYELSSLPIKDDLIKKISTLTKRLDVQSGENKDKSVNKINEIIYDYYGLNRKEIHRINDLFQINSGVKND